MAEEIPDNNNNATHIDEVSESAVEIVNGEAVEESDDNSGHKKSCNNLPAKVKKNVIAKPKDSEVITPEEEAKVEQAYNDIKNIFIEEFKQAAQNAMLKVGQYLINNFYKNYEEAAEKKYSKNKSLYKLFNKFKQEIDGNSPQKSWLYNSIDLALAENKYKQYQLLTTDDKKIKVFSIWNGHLTISHKITLIHAKDLEEDKIDDLIIETSKNNYKVLELQNRIAEIQGKPLKGGLSPLQASLKSLQKEFSVDKLKAFDDSELKKFKKEVNSLLKQINEALSTKDKPMQKDESETIEVPTA